MKKTKRQNPIKLLILGVVMAVLILGYHFHLSKRAVQVQEPKKISVADELLLRNLNMDYPPSPKEVVKYYAEITKCFYDGSCSSEQLKKLAEKSRELFDAELRDTQTDDKYFKDLNVDIAYYAQNNLKISSYSTSSSVDVEYSNTPEGELASLHCLFNIREGTTLKSSDHLFILRKDKAGHWKILGWTLAPDEDE